MDTVEYVIPAPCVGCQKVEGMPFKAETMANGDVCVSFRCRVCLHEWDLAMVSGKFAIAAKPDRRKPATEN